MGMTCGLVQASDADIVRLRANPTEAIDFIEDGEWAPPVRQVRPKGVLGWLLRLTPITIEEVDPDAIAPRVRTRNHADLISTSTNAWHGCTTS